MAAAKVQLCGRFVVELDDRRVEAALPGRQGRLLLAYLVLHRARPVARDELVEALWRDGRNGGLAPLLSKLRRVVPFDGLRPDLPGLRVDVEDAAAAVHRAESALALGRAAAAWAPAQIAMEISARPFLAGEEGAWVDAERRRLADVHVRALEAYAAATLGIGGTELAAAVRAGRSLVELEPYRESGHRLLMEALDRQGNTAEALIVYETLRRRLSGDLGVTPSAQTLELHRRLLR
ncbi:MAG TPA: BTAD domain-containing putative transcriptional regulator [Gaiellaceae bacterium]